MSEIQKLLIEDKQFMTAIKAQDRWQKRVVSIAEYEAHVICMSKPFRIYYANVFVLNKVSRFILDGSPNPTLVLWGYYPEKEQGIVEEGGILETRERSSAKQVQDLGPQGPSKDYHRRGK